MMISVKKRKYFFLSSAFLQIVAAFFILVTIKIFLSFYFKSPWIFADESIYAETARNILQGDFYSKIQFFRGYPPGYSLFLVIAYLLSENSGNTYQLMLIINSFLTSSIIFPAFFLLKKLCSEKFSLLGSIFIAVSPSVFLYNFVVMSENLFIPLFAFSLWFIIESFETNSKTWGILAGFSIFLLFFTRVTGIAMIIGFFLALIYYGLMQIKLKGPLTLVKELFFPVTSFCIPTIIWLYYKSRLEGLDYSAAPYNAVILQSLSNIDFFIRFLSLIIHEFEFLILSSYFILFVFALYSICLILVTFSGYPSKLEEKQKNVAIKTGTFYFLVSSILLVIITVAHMSIALSENDLRYLIFGRYIDPAVPIISIFGLIGLYNILNKNFEKKKNVVFLTLSMLSLFILFVIDFPSKSYKFPNMFTIFYIQKVVEFIPVIQFIGLFVILLLVWFTVIQYHKKFWPVFIIFLISISVIGIYFTLQIQYSESSKSAELTEISTYLIKNSNESSRILMTNDDYNKYWGTRIFWATQFYIKGHLIKNDICKNMSMDNCQPIQDSDYIISSKILPYHSIITTKSGYHLYTLQNSEDHTIELPYIIDIGINDEEKIENFYPPDNNQMRWTKNNSKISIEYPKQFGELNLSVNFGGIRPADNPAIVTFLLNDHPLGNVTYTGNRQTTISYNIPDRYLNNYYNVLEIDTNTWNPGDYNSEHNGYLGILVDWVSVQSNDLENSNNSCQKYPFEKNTDFPIMLCNGWYPLENLSGIPSYWMNSNASLIIYSNENRTSMTVMEFSSFYQKRALNISTERQQDLQEIIPSGFETGFVKITIPVRLHQGKNTIGIKALEGCQVPRDFPGLNYSDSRCISVLMRNLTIS